MNYFSGLLLLIALLIGDKNLTAQTSQQVTPHATKYVCLPCGQACDSTISDTPGICTACNMRLFKKSTVYFKTISPAEISRYVKNHRDVVLLDVRTKVEFEGKADPNYPTLKNAINIPVQELESRLDRIANLKKRKIIVYCSRSHRSALACYILTQNGFKDVTNMSGGVSVITPDELIK